MAEAKYSNSNGIVNDDKENVTTEVKANGHLPLEPTYPSHPRTSSSLRRGCSAKGSPPMRIAMSVRAKTASTSSDGSSHEIKLSERRASRDREKMGGMLDGGVGSGGVREEEGTAERPESREAQENKGVCVCVCVCVSASMHVCGVKRLGTIKTSHFGTIIIF